MIFLTLMHSEYGKIFIIISYIIFGLIAVYNRIKYLCLKKASEMVAKAESHYELSGEEKFALCVLWIEESFPKIFRNALFKAIVSKLIQFVYENSYDYTKKYIKKKTGYDISELLEEIKKITEEKKKEIEEEDKEES